MTLANFPKGFNNGVTIQGMPIAMMFATSQATLGNTAKTGVYWVDSANGLDGNTGTYQLPLATLGRAFALCSANDVIVLKPGHAESVSSATAASGKWNVAGVTVVGLGVGTQRPNITLDTANTSTINVSAANISVQNVIFTANFLNIATLFTLTTAKGFTLNGCEVVDKSASLNFLNVLSTNGTANAADKLSIVGNSFFLAATSGVVNLYAPGAAEDRVTITDNIYIAQTTNAAAVLPLSTFAHTNFVFLRNLINVQNAAGTATGIIITGTGASTGWIHGNYYAGLATTPLPVTAGTGLRFGANYWVDAADTSGYLLPVADS